MKKQILTIMVMTLLLLSSAQAITFTTTSDEATVGYKELTVSFLNQDPDPVEPGKLVDVRFKIENTGENTLRDLQVELLPEFPLQFEAGETPVREIGNLDPYIKGERSLVLKWRLKVNQDAVEGDSEVKIRYTTNQGQSWTQIEDLFVNVKSTEKILSVNQVRVEPEEVGPGQSANINFELENLADGYLKNVKVQLDLSEVPFGVVESSTEKVIEKIAGASIQTLNFKVIANNDAELKVYNIPFTLEYMDNSGNEYSASSSFGIKVDSTPEFILNVEDNTANTEESTGEVVVSISNTGPSNINFVAFEIMEGEGYEVIGPTLKYLGNLESDDFETEQFNIHLTEDAEEQVDLKIKVTYKDAYNNGYEHFEDLGIRVYSDKEARQLGLVQGGGSIGTIIVVVLILAGIVFWWWRRKR